MELERQVLVSHAMLSSTLDNLVAEGGQTNVDKITLAKLDEMLDVVPVDKVIEEKVAVQARVNTIRGALEQGRLVGSDRTQVSLASLGYASSRRRQPRSAAGGHRR